MAKVYSSEISLDESVLGFLFPISKATSRKQTLFLDSELKVRSANLLEADSINTATALKVWHSQELHLSLPLPLADHNQQEFYELRSKGKSLPLSSK